MEKLKEIVKHDTRKLLKHLKKKFKNEKKNNNTHKQENAHVKNLKRQLMTKD